MSNPFAEISATIPASPPSPVAKTISGLTPSIDLSSHSVLVSTVRVQAFVFPTDAPEADGTFEWTATTLVVVEVTAGPVTGIGYTYSDASTVELIANGLASAVVGQNVFDIGRCWQNLQNRVRNLGRSGLCAAAISAIDAALWDAKSKLLGLPLAKLLGMVRDAVPIYGSGGFTTYSAQRMKDQLSAWVNVDGCRCVKIKIGTHPERDPQRVRDARSAIGDAALFVDANGALSVKSALATAEQLADAGVTWFEEPVSSDDVQGLCEIRRRAPATIDIAAGEYGYNADDFRRLLEEKAVDVLQADASRCGGVTGFLLVGALCDAFHTPLSAHCAPGLHRHVACAVPRLRHQEWFHDHVRIESRLFDGAPAPRDGVIQPDLSRAGLGLELRASDALRYRVGEWSSR